MQEFKFVFLSQKECTLLSVSRQSSYVFVKVFLCSVGADVAHKAVQVRLSMIREAASETYKSTT